MLKKGILNPQLSSVLASTGHMDMLVVTDAGLPLAKEVERVDLAFKPFNPRFLDVLKEVLDCIVVEKIILAEEIKVKSPKMLEEILNLFPKDMCIEFVPHTEFKKITREARAYIRSGEFTPYANIILVAGCAY